MKKVYILIVLLFLNCVGKAQGMSWTTMTTALPDNYGNGATDAPRGKVSVVDAWGNMYVTAKNGYLAKFNNSGQQIWSVGFGDNNYSIDADTLGYIYITGDSIVSKLDSSGTIIWSLNVDLSGNDIAVDNQGNVFVAGSTWGSSDMDPGPGVVPVDTPGALLVKFNSAGTFLWAYVDNWEGYDKYYNAVDLDDDGNVYVVGVYGQMTWRQGFARKITSDGNMAWIHEYSSTGTLGEDVFDVKVNDSGYVYTFGIKNYKPGNGGDYFVHKMDTAGNALDITAFAVGAMYSWSGALDVDNYGNVYFTGCANISGPGVDFDPGPGQAIFSSYGFPAMFIMKLDAGMNFEWASAHYIPNSMSNYSSTYAFNIDVDDNCNVYVTGVIDSDVDVDVDPGAGTYVLNGLGTFIQKIGCSAAGVNSVSTQTKDLMVYPNPSNGEINISSPSVIHVVQITDVMGRVVYSALPDSKVYKAEADIANGMYYITLTTDDGKNTEKLVIGK